MRRTMAAMCIYPCYFSFIFLVLLMLASIFADFLRLYEVPHLEEATFRVYQSKFLRLKRKLFVSCAYGRSMDIFVILSLLKLT